MSELAPIHLGVAAVYRLEGAYPNERFEIWQRVKARPCVQVEHISLSTSG